MGYGTLYARAEQLEQATAFARTLARYMGDVDVGEALERLNGSALPGRFDSA